MVTPWTIQEVVAACTGSKVKYEMKYMRLIWLDIECENLIAADAFMKNCQTNSKSMYFAFIAALKVPPFLDFFITWIALSNSFWNPFLYWLLNAHFRRLSRELILRKVSKKHEIPIIVFQKHSAY